MQLEQPITAQWLPKLAEQLMRNVLKDWAEIEVLRLSGALSEIPPLAVSIKIGGAYDSCILLYGDRSFFFRLAQTLFECSKPTQEEVEEAAKEFLNILCGQLISAIYDKTGIPARFYPPCFFETADVPPADLQKGQRLYFCSDRHEHLLLYFADTIIARKGDDTDEIPCNGSR